MDVLEFCRYIVDILKMCMWVFDGYRINYDRLMAFQTKIIFGSCFTVGYGVCVINFSYSFLWMSQILQTYFRLI